MADIRGPDYELAEKDYMLGMKYKDIAEKYDVSINTVKSWKQRYKWNRKGVHTKEKGVHTKTNAESKKKEPIADEVKSVLKNTELNDKQRLFCLYYSKSFNATRSYQKAYGCTYETAMANGSELLRNAKIKDEIYKLKKQRMNQAFLEPSDIFQRYMDIAFSDITDYARFGKREVETELGPREMNYVDFKESTEVDGSIISEVKQGRDGVSIKLNDRMKALDWLSKHMDIATEEQKARIEKIKAETNKLESENKEQIPPVINIIDTWTDSNG